MAPIRTNIPSRDLTPKQHFLRMMLDRFKTVNNAESRLRKDMLDDFEFRYDKQWPEQTKREREADGRPCLTINRIPQFLSQVTNQERQLRPAIQVNPVDSASDVNTAEALQGIIRNIEINSDSDVAYSTACDHQVTAGRGYWRVFTRYADDDGYEQNITIERVLNPFSVYVDPSHTRVDAADARYAFIIQDIPKDEFINMYGEQAYSNMSLAASVGNSVTPDWMPEGSVRVVEYFYKETKVEEIAELSFMDPETGTRSMIRLRNDEIPDSSDMPDDWRIVSRRKIEIDQVKWALCTPTDVLEGSEDLTEGQDFPCRYIPIVQVLGHESYLNGRRDLRGMVRGAKDPQRMYSFWASALTEVIAMTPRSPYIGVEGQFAGHEAKWNTANRKNYAYLEVKATTVGNQFVGFPQRQQFEPAIQAIVQAFQLADNDLKAVMGLYDASLGQQGPEQSGTAILARQRQGEIGNSNYIDNMGRGIRHCGRIVLDMIPRVYTPIRILRILGVDDKPKAIVINNGQPPEDADAIAAAQGIPDIYDISVGRYDVSISTGSRHASRRQEAAQAMLQLVNSTPEIMKFVGDLLVKNMDWPGAAEIAARLRRLVPPEVLGEGAPPIPPEIQQQMQEFQEQFAKVQAENAELKQKAMAREAELAAKAQIVAASNASREKISAEDNKVDLIREQMKIEAQKSMEILKSELAKINTRIDAINEFNLAAAERAGQALLEHQKASLAERSSATDA